MTEDEVIEKMARAMAESDLEDYMEDHRRYDARARAIVSLLPSLGLVLVPVEATERMLDVVDERDDFGPAYNAMLRASPFYKGERG